MIHYLSLNAKKKPRKKGVRAKDPIKAEKLPSLKTSRIWLKRLLVSPWTILAFVATVAEFLSAFPHLSVSPASSLRSADPMSTIFLLSNDGLLPIHDVAWSGEVLKIECCYGEGLWDGRGGSVTAPDENLKILLPSHKAAFPFSSHIKLEDVVHVSADIVLKVEYRPDFYPPIFPRWHDNYRFKTQEDEKGQYIWVPE